METLRARICYIKTHPAGGQRRTESRRPLVAAGVGWTLVA